MLLKSKIAAGMEASVTETATVGTKNAGAESPPRRK